MKALNRCITVILIFTLVCITSSTSSLSASANITWLGDEVDMMDDFSDGYVTVYHRNPDTSVSAGLIDSTGKLVVPFRYGDVTYVGDGLALLDNGYFKQGYYDIRAGKELLPPQYVIVGSFSEGLAWVRTGGTFTDNTIKFGYIDRTGAFVLPLVYDSISNFKNDVAVVKKDGHWYVIDKTGQIVKVLPYDDIEQFYDGMAAVWQGDKLGYIDEMGNEVIPPIYESLDDKRKTASEFENGVAQIQLNGKCNIIDKTGKLLLSEFYDTAGYYDEGYFIVGNSVNGSTWQFTYGLADPNGNQITPVIYHEISEGFQDGMVWIRPSSDEEKYGFIDKSGKEVIPAIYDEMIYFNNGMGFVKK